MIGREIYLQRPKNNSKTACCLRPDALHYKHTNRKTQMNTALKIENVRRATLNGRAVKIFTAYCLVDSAYVHIGQFSAPARTAKKDLPAFITE